MSVTTNATDSMNNTNVKEDINMSVTTNATDSMNNTNTEEDINMSVTTNAADSVNNTNTKENTNMLANINTTCVANAPYTIIDVYGDDDNVPTEALDMYEFIDDDIDSCCGFMATPLTINDIYICDYTDKTKCYHILLDDSECDFCYDDENLFLTYNIALHQQNKSILENNSKCKLMESVEKYMNDDLIMYCDKYTDKNGNSYIATNITGYDTYGSIVKRTNQSGKANDIVELEERYDTIRISGPIEANIVSMFTDLEFYNKLGFGYGMLAVLTPYLSEISDTVNRTQNHTSNTIMRKSPVNVRVCPKSVIADITLPLSVFNLLKDYAYATGMYINEIIEFFAERFIRDNNISHDEYGYLYGVRNHKIDINNIHKEIN